MPPRKRSQPASGPPDEDPRPGEDTGASGPPETSGSGGGPGRGTGGPPLERDPDADPVRIHREYVQRRLGGGALPTPEAYERALDQGHRLGGSVRRPASEVRRDDREAREVERRAQEGRGPGEPESYDGPLPATDPGDNSPYEDRSR